MRAVLCLFFLTVCLWALPEDPLQTPAAENPAGEKSLTEKSRANDSTAKALPTQAQTKSSAAKPETKSAAAKTKHSAVKKSAPAAALDTPLLVNLPIDTSKNHIVFPAGNAALAPFLHKLDSLVYTGQGTVNILHLGGSHIQADIISNRIRTRLVRDLSLPAASRGFVFPFTAARSNTPVSYASRRKGHFKWERSVRKNRQKPLGLIGFEVTTIDPESEVRIVLDSHYPNDKFWYFTKVRVFGSSPDSIEPVLQLEQGGLHYFGVKDSIAESFVFEIPRRADSLILTFPWKNEKALAKLNETLAPLDSAARDSLFADTNFFKTQPSFTLTGILLSDTVPGLTYNSIGVNGASLESFLSIENFERDLDFSRPDLVIFSIGINDANVENFDKARFKSHFDTLVSKIRAVAPKAAFIFMSNNDCYLTKTKQPNKNSQLVSEAVAELAEKHRGGVWDMYAVMGGFKSMETWFLADYAQKDRVHFKNAGYELLGDLFYDALIEIIRPDAKKITRIPKDIPVSKKRAAKKRKSP